LLEVRRGYLHLIIAGLQLKDPVLAAVVRDRGSRRVRRDIPDGDRRVLDDGSLLILDRSFDRSVRILTYCID
jgi:hypothetical protein